MNHAINQLIQYGLDHGLIDPYDRYYVANTLIDLFSLSQYEEESIEPNSVCLQDVLNTMLDHAIEQGMIEDTITQKDLLDTRIMNTLMPRPSEVVHHFEELKEQDPKKATDYFYDLSIHSNYIRMDRIKKNIEFMIESKYAPMKITINLSKPEKDPKEIAKASALPSSQYPKCLLCKENVGFAGTLNHPARQNHRILPLSLTHGSYAFQYSPYVYYDQHCIILNEEHTPMRIDQDTFENLFSFVEQFPHYMLGSNTDIPIVGGSILSHDHYQGGAAHFPIEEAKVFYSDSLPNMDVELLEWPLSTIRLSSRSKEALVKASMQILEAWKKYEDKDREIIPYTNGTRHNAITPIVRKKNGKFEIDLVLRNNRTSEQYPDGIFHPHPEHHHIKKENIGLIEVMGLAILPGRLKKQKEEIISVLKGEASIDSLPDLAMHRAWIESLQKSENKSEDLDRFINQAIGDKFVQVLENAGVFKMDVDGKQGMIDFFESVKKDL